MPHTVLITTHPGAALAKACMRGSWVPLPLPEHLRQNLSHLVILSPTATAIEVVGRIWTFQCIGTLDDRLDWLPLLDGCRRLRHPIPLGDGPLLDAWLPRHGLQWRQLPLHELLIAESVAALLSERAAQGWVDSDDPAPGASPGHGSGTSPPPGPDPAHRSADRPG